MINWSWLGIFLLEGAYGLINFLNMKYFLVVAETRSFSAAAKQLYISQQTLSAHIAQMESEIGTKLFERTRPLSLTLAGERFLRGVREILFINSQMERELQDIIDPHSNAFRVAISHAYARSILPVILRQFYSRFPQVNLQLYEMSYKEMDKALAAGKIDLIISRTFHHGANVNVIPLYNDDDVYLYAPFSTLRQVYGDKMPEILEILKRRPCLSAVRECPFILPRAGNVRQNADHLFLEERLTPFVRMEVETLESAIVYCRNGLGVTLAPRMLLAGERSPEYHLLSKKRPEYALAICHREDTHLTYAMKSFINILRKTDISEIYSRNVDFPLIQGS